MRYAEYRPATPLAALVERFWLLEGSSMRAADAIIPDGRVELIFHYGGPFLRHDGTSAAVKQPASLLVGQMVEPVVLAPEGPAGVAAEEIHDEGRQDRYDDAERQHIEDDCDEDENERGAPRRRWIRGVTHARDVRSGKRPIVL